MSANVTACITVNMKQFKSLLKNVSPDTAICVRGRHAVGKSEGVYQSAAEQRSDFYKDPENCARMVEAFGGYVRHADGMKTEWNYECGLPVMERRLSQMTEGDTIGLPFDSKYGTVFKACDWLVKTSVFPSVLFLDERNRALDGVKQSVFQLCDSKAFYGTKLHKETRVIIAENVGDEYQVQACDPAEVSRTATVELKPSVEDWLNYASGRCHRILVEFIRNNQNLLEHSGPFEPNVKYPDRRAWFKLDEEAQRLGLYDDPSNPLFRVLVGSMVGGTVQNTFVNYVRDHNRQVSAEDVLKSWKKAKKRLESAEGQISNEQFIEVSHKLVEYLKNAEITLEQGYQAALFMFDSPSEVVMTTWTGICQKTENLTKVHRFTKDLMVAVSQAESRDSIQIPSFDEVKSAMGSDTGKKCKKTAKKAKAPAKSSSGRGASKRKQR